MNFELISEYVGGFEFGCMTGVMLGAAANHCLTIIDGFNSTATRPIRRACRTGTTFLRKNWCGAASTSS